ncbi:MAG: hypothetical protein H8E27_15425 [Verrucomicrobia subdivision 3 bacterium]|nr:hypothetical protein [Limisphaerales bacterium]
MRFLSTHLIALVICCAANAADISDSLKTIRAVGPEGKGNAAAAQAWQSLAQAEPAKLPQILAAMDGTNPLAANWLRAAVDTIAGRSKDLPQMELMKFIANQKHDPRARRLAYELIKNANPKLAAKLIPGLLNDPSVELRRDAVQRVMDEGANLKKINKPDLAQKQYRKALDAARDIDQIKTITTALRALGQKVDLPHHFGFLMQWTVIGPFDNTDRTGFAKIFPPEHKIDLTANYDGKTDKVKWSPFVTANEYGMVDINKAYPGPGDGLKEVTAYAYTEYHTADARAVELRLGCKNAWKIWHNGKLIFGRDEYHRGMRIDQYKLNVQLTKGRNTLLVKLCQNEQEQDWTKEWQFQLRVCDATGTAILAADRPPTPKTGTDNNQPANPTRKPRK